MDKKNLRAFPRKLPDIECSPAEVEDIIDRYSGMTLRDYFAAAALTGLLCYQRSLCVQPAYIARQAFEYADAMMTERSRG